jgi:FkbM family methyltransferase
MSSNSVTSHGSDILNSTQLLVERIDSLPLSLPPGRGFRNGSLLKMPDGWIFVGDETNQHVGPSGIIYMDGAATASFQPILVQTTDNFVVKSYHKLITEFPSSIKSLRDARIFRASNAIWVTMRAVMNEGPNLVVMGRLTENRVIVKLMVIFIDNIPAQIACDASGPQPRCWAPFNGTLDIRLATSVEPWNVLTGVPETCQMLVIEQHAALQDKQLNIGTPFVTWRNGWLCLVYETAMHNSQHIYAQRFLYRSEKCEAETFISPVFHFMTRSMEVASGLHLQGDLAYISFGMADQRTLIALVDLNKIMLLPLACYTNKVQIDSSQPVAVNVSNNDSNSNSSSQPRRDMFTVLKTLELSLLPSKLKQPGRKMEPLPIATPPMLPVTIRNIVMQNRIQVFSLPRIAALPSEQTERRYFNHQNQLGLWTLFAADTPITVSVRAEPYKEKLLQFLSKLVPDYSTVIDVGAHVGLISIPLARIVKRVYAFEMQQEVYYLLQRNLLQNRSNNIVSYNCALGASSSLAYIPKCNYLSESSTDFAGLPVISTIAGVSGSRLGNQGLCPTLVLGDAPAQDLTAVEMMRLDQLGINHISLIKVSADNSGEIFYGAQETIRRECPVLVFSNIMVSSSISTSCLVPADFSIETFCAQLGYHSPFIFGPDRILIPNRDPELLRMICSLCRPGSAFHFYMRGNDCFLEFGARGPFPVHAPTQGYVMVHFTDVKETYIGLFMEAIIIWNNQTEWHLG